MENYGTGATYIIWMWWAKFWEKEVKEQGIVGILKGIFPFIITIIGVIIMFIVDSFVAIIKGIIDLFSSKEDDNVRDIINESSCSSINRLSDNKIVEMINILFDGPTLDEDENAILKLLGCLDCNRLHIIVNRVGLSRLQSEIDGEEYDNLQVLLGRCGIISFSEWDDDATRNFVNRASCQQINALSAENLHQLFRNLIEGFCGDEDENAINKIMNCTDCNKIRQILNMNGTRWDDFDDAIQGAEWDNFKAILRNRCHITG